MNQLKSTNAGLKEIIAFDLEVSLLEVANQELSSSVLEFLMKGVVFTLFLPTPETFCLASLEALFSLLFTSLDRLTFL